MVDSFVNLGPMLGSALLWNLFIGLLLGVGSFTILDSGKVTGQDAGNNFFLHRDSIGKSRAEEAVRFLAELNDSVTGKADTRVSVEVWIYGSRHIAMGPSLSCHLIL